jgi:antitoxin (DNA-binding transcriptional repressor) of toxin-antitoxin stability system
MQELTISKFKATCCRVLAELGKSGVPLRITRRGIPIAEIVAPRVLSDAEWIGSMRGAIEIHGDIVGPVGAFGGWE